MRVMMIGVVAMLGTKVEAHYYAFKGKAKYCSVCVDAELADHEEHAVNLTNLIEVPALHREKVEFCVTTESIDILCPSKAKRVWKRVRLPVVRQLIVPDATTVQGIVSDDSLKTPDLCQGLLPDAVLIRAMELKIKTYACAILDLKKCESVSELKGRCRLSTTYGFSDVGSPYDCSWGLPQIYQNDGPDEADGTNNDGSFTD